MTTLYRKWRPQTFAEVRGQERVVRTLQNALSAGRIGHAYLFCGPRGVGKTTTARLLAKAVNCLHDDQPPAAGTIPVEPDNTCSICRQIADGRSLDVVEIDAASNGRVDDARDLRDQINFAPNEAKYKFYIIDEAHQITKDAFDALLKTFEEPPPHVIFVLATTDPNKVPPTILSRCQRFDFRRISVADIRASLTDICAAEAIQAEPAALEMLARAADGSSRDSQSLLDQAIAFCGTSVTLAGVRSMLGLASADTIEQLAEALLQGDAPSGLELINAATDAGVDPRGLNRELVEHLRNLLLLKVSAASAPTLDVAPETLPSLRERAAGLSAATLVRQIKIFSEADYGFRVALQPQLPLELAFLEAIAAAMAVDAVAPSPPPAPRPAPPNPVRDAPPARPVTAAPSRVAPAPAAGAHAAEPAPPANARPAVVESPAEPEPVVLASVGSVEPALAEKLDDGPPATPPAREPIQAAEAKAEWSPPVLDAVPDAPVSGEDAGLLQLVNEKWPAVLQTVRAQSKNVEALLRGCAAVALDGATVTLACEGEFHVRELQKPENKRMVEGALSRVAGRPCYVKCVVRNRTSDGPKPASGPSDAAKPDEDDPLVRAALRMLNARLLENS